MELAKKAIKGTAIVAGSSYVVDLIALGRSIILARLLVPEYFGIVALAHFFFNSIRGLKEFNFDAALIYRSKATADIFSTHFIIKTSLAVINLLIILIISPFLTKFYGPSVVRIIFIFTFFSIFQEAAATPRVVLEKELLFGRVSTINIIKEVGKTVIPIIMAQKGAGLWSLVVMGILDMLIPFFGYMIIKPWRVSFRISREALIWFFRFSLSMWLAGLCMIFIYGFDNFLVGTMVGTIALGLYTKAYEFAKLPTQMVTHIVNKVSLPLYSKLKDNRTELSRSFNNFLYIIIRLALPFSFLLFIIAPEFVYLFLGQKWSGVILLLRLLTIYGVLRSIQDDCGSLFCAVGKPNILTRIFLIQTIAMISLGPIFVYFLKVKGMAIFIDLLIFMGILLSYKNILTYVDVEYNKNFVAPLLSALAGGILVFIVLQNFSLNGLVNRLIVKFILFIGAYTLILILLTRAELKTKLRYLIQLIKEGA